MTVSRISLPGNLTGKVTNVPLICLFVIKVQSLDISKGFLGGTGALTRSALLCYINDQFNIYAD